MEPRNNYEYVAKLLLGVAAANPESDLTKQWKANYVKISGYEHAEDLFDGVMARLREDA